MLYSFQAIQLNLRISYEKWCLRNQILAGMIHKLVTDLMQVHTFYFGFLCTPPTVSESGKEICIGAVQQQAAKYSVTVNS